MVAESTTACKNKISILIALSFCLIFCQSNIWGYSWPVEEFDKQHTINTTVGEPRSDEKGIPTRFHSGVDIKAADGTPVYSIDSGKVLYPKPTPKDPKNMGVIIKNKAYIHLQKMVDENTYLIGIDNPAGTLPDKIGEVYAGQGHVHLSENGGASNPLRKVTEGGLSPFVDNVWPEVWDVRVFRDTTAGGKDDETGDRKQEITGSIIDGKIDLRGRAKDFRTNAEGNSAGHDVGIYQITYQAVDATVDINKITRMEPDYDNIKFNYTPDKSLINIIYDTSLSNMTTFYYWVTNSMTEDRYWNTKLHKDVKTWDGEDARINEEAKCPDGKYEISVMAKDIAGNGGDVENKKGAETIERMIDNFLPYVQQVTIRQDGTEKYQAHWSTSSVSSTNLGELIKENDTQFQSGKVEIELLFSENMNKAISPQVKVAFASGLEKVPTTTGAWIDDKTWKITTEDDFIPTAETGEAILKIEGAQDLAGNLLDGNPQTIASRKIDQPSQWERAEATPDASYKFKILKLSDWPMVNHDTGLTRYNPDATLEPPFSLKWSTSGLNIPVPVISRGILYYTDLVDSIPKEIRAVDAITGELKWSRIIGTWHLGEISVVNENLYVWSGDGYMYALNAETGNTIWSQQCFPNQIPIVADNAIYFSSLDGKVYKINADSGDISSGWQYQILTIDPFTGFLAMVDVSASLKNVVDGVVYINYAYGDGGFLPPMPAPSLSRSKSNLVKNRVILPTFEHGIAAFNEATGGYIWHKSLTYSLADSGYKNILAVNNGKIYTYGKDAPLDPTIIEALDYGGNSLWSFTIDGQKRLSVAQGKVYIDYDAYNTANGEAIWHYAAGVGNVESTSVANDNVYILSNDTLYVLEADSGDLQWSYPINGGKELAIANDMVYVATDNSLYCFGSSDPKSPAPAIDSVFTLGEVYSYPNPAKRRNPTIHIEVGVADKVELNIYDVAGELIHSTELIDMLEVIDSKYAYEYTWNISNVASGVYLYHVQASKNGEGDITILKKLAIIK